MPNEPSPLQRKQKQVKQVMQNPCNVMTQSLLAS
jgi:hypothetical protein